MHSNGVCWKSLLLVLCLPVLPAPGQRFTAWLPAGSEAGMRAVSFGFLAAEGRFHDMRPPVVLAGARRLEPQIDVRSRWPDGSYRWLRLVVPLRLSPARPAEFSVRPGKKAAARVREVVLQPGAHGLRVVTGRLRFELAPDCARPLRLLAHAGRTVIEGLSLGLRGDPAEWVIEEQGPYRFVACLTGRLWNSDHAPVRIRLRLTADLLTGEIAVENRLAPMAGLLPEGAFRYVLELADDVRRVHRFGRWRLLKKLGPPCGLESDSAGPVTFRGRAGIEPASSGVLRLTGTFGKLAVALEDLGPRGPAVLGLTTPRCVTATCVSSSYHWYSGVRPGRALYLSAAGGKRGASIRIAARPLILRMDTGRREPALPGLAAELALLDDVIAEELVPEQAGQRGLRWRGEENLGDWRWNAKDAGNLEYDTTAGYRAAARIGDTAERLQAANRAARHLFQRDLDAGGLPLMHGAFHRRGGLEAGHMWLDGLLDECVSSGDLFLAEDLEALLAAWEKAAPRLVRGRLNMRSIAWSVLFASAAARAGSKVGRDVLNELCGRLADTPGTSLFLVDRYPKTEDLYRVSPWVTVGILGEALAAAPPVANRSRAVARFLRSIPPTLSAAWRGPERGLADALACTEGGVPSARGLACGEEGLIFALGLARAGAMERKATWRKAAEEVARWASGHLALSRTRFSGMRLSQLMWTAPRLWRQP